ncbi:MAG: hypothetical protein CSB47_03070 [Proteobacteria bacterium]|nr:MAG: hypothetical protein CSB47_03070 [Pseudomonadota bacterium]
MQNNEAFRRIRFALELDNETTLEIFEAGQYECSSKQVERFSKKESDTEFSDKTFAHFLNGLIVFHRGGKAAEVSQKETMDNNKILKKLRIALELYEDEMLNIFDLGGIKFSRHKLSALFRADGHKHFRECNDHTLRQFLKGLAIYHQRQQQDA